MHQNQTLNVLFLVILTIQILIIQFYWSVILKHNGSLRTHGEQTGDLVVMDTSVETLITIAALDHKSFWEESKQRNKNALFKTVKFVYKTVTVQNANLGISLPTKTVHKCVLNVTTQTVQSVKITLGIVKHVFLDTLYISLNKFVKFQ